ncbi:MAG: hypothetical protein ACJ77L_01275 [Solirubrobacteraceae bacterium]|jgi:hypothetical protein
MPATDVRRLDDEAVARKLEALCEDRTRFRALSGGALRIVEHPAVRGFEVAWWLRE